MSLLTYLEKQLGTKATPQLVFGNETPEKLSERKFRLPLNPERIDLTETSLLNLIVNYYHDKRLDNVPRAVQLRTDSVSLIPENCIPQEYVYCTYTGRSLWITISRTKEIIPLSASLHP